ncbi:S-layer homology domain-containing protein [Caloranaerobacter ferrireducens]|uniref:S-layer homology domain-containing protein n=1 Tax=Caloranaerobacter ferrireducens TaxID=1323370 RepID=UPI00084DC7CA|nr:S-layer homology domain-containing protein [Caloranaerobacter ferrireducens]
MKKIIALLTTVIMVVSIASVSYGVLGQEAAAYEGLPAYKELYNNINFADIKSHWAKDSIYRMSSLSVIKGVGYNKFYPDGTLTREQAIALLVRLLGLESQAQISGENSIKNSDTGGYTILTPNDYWSRGYIDVALQNNIITQEEVDDILTLTEEEQNDLELEIEKEIVSYETDPDLTDNQIKNIENQLREKIEKKYTWKKPADREQVAIWVSRILDLKPIYGQAQQKIYNLKDWQKIKTTNIPIIEALLQKGVMKGDDRGYFNPKGYLKRAEMAKLLDNIFEDFLLKQGYKIGTGLVERIDKNYQIDEKTTIEKKIFRIKDDDNNILNFIAQESEDDVYDRGFLVYKNGSLTKYNELNEYDYIKYYINPQNNVVFVEILNNIPVLLDGTVEKIGDNQITIRDYLDDIHSFNIIPGVDIRVNNNKAKLSDLLYGQDVTLTISGGKVIKIDGYIDIEEEGYIHPGDRIFIGKVLYIDSQDNKLTLLKDNNEYEFIIKPYVPVIKGDTNINLSSIKEGDIVKLEFDQYEGNMPVKVNVYTDDRQFENIIKGKLDFVNLVRNEIILSNVFYYEHAKWLYKDESMKLSLDSDVDIYFDGLNIPKENLKQYLGKEVYLATDKKYGKEEAFKIILKNGYERNYYNSIQDIAYGQNKIKVDYNEIYYDSKSTIIIKDGRVIHPYNLNKGDDIYVISQGKDKYTAALISVENIPSTGLVIYRGRIDEIGEYKFELDDYDVLKDNNWDFSTKQISFDISEDTKILDTRNDNPIEVSIKDFTNSRFLEDKYSINSYYRKYAYVVKYDDMTIAMNVIDENTNPKIITVADVDNVDKINKNITLKNIKDWNEFKGIWNINNATFTLDVNKALIIKEGQNITINDISPGDSLYILRNNNVGYIVVVR